MREKKPNGFTSPSITWFNKPLTPTSEASADIKVSAPSTGKASDGISAQISLVVLNAHSISQSQEIDSLLPFLGDKTRSSGAKFLPAFLMKRR